MPAAVRAPSAKPRRRFRFRAPAPMMARLIGIIGRTQGVRFNASPPSRIKPSVASDAESGKSCPKHFRRRLRRPATGPGIQRSRRLFRNPRGAAGDSKAAVSSLPPVPASGIGARRVLNLAMECVRAEHPLAGFREEAFLIVATLEGHGECQVRGRIRGSGVRRREVMREHGLAFAAELVRIPLGCRQWRSVGASASFKRQLSAYRAVLCRHMERQRERTAPALVRDHRGVMTNGLAPQPGHTLCSRRSDQGAAARDPGTLKRNFVPLISVASASSPAHARVRRRRLRGRTTCVRPASSPTGWRPRASWGRRARRVPRG